MEFPNGAVHVVNITLFVVLTPKDVQTKVLPKVSSLLDRALLCVAVPWWYLSFVLMSRLSFLIFFQEHLLRRSPACSVLSLSIFKISQS